MRFETLPMVRVLVGAAVLSAWVAPARADSCAELRSLIAQIDQNLSRNLPASERDYQLQARSVYADAYNARCRGGGGGGGGGYSAGGGFNLAAIEKRWPVDKRHAPLSADLARRFGGHPDFKEAVESVEAEIPGRRECDTPSGGSLESFAIVDPEDYRRYKAAHANRNWTQRKVRDELLPLVANAPCLAYFEFIERSDAREGLRTLADAIEVSGLLRVPPEATLTQTEELADAIMPALLHTVLFLGWLAAGLP